VKKTKKIEEGEMVMTHLRKEIFSGGTYSKINYKKNGPCRIMRKNFYNAYKLELLEDFEISPIFNVVDLYEFHEGEENDKKSTLANWKKQLHVKSAEELEQILVKRVSKRTQNKEYYEYLMK
jgi:hypothetical protein